MTVGGVDTYYDYDERQWKSRRLGGRSIPVGPVCPIPARSESDVSSYSADGSDLHGEHAAVRGDHAYNSRTGD
ncbi:MAG: hypothetical protein QOH03_802 [Kribbellaceae bacterium]|jgi:hypothetical protein|nr:hypothetical protein [Kribbellaceae bacterium]